jgi:hypothetical protein
MSHELFSSQSYPPPTWLPGMRAGETDGRYMDCSPALNPISDAFTDITTISILVTRADGQPMTASDLRIDPDWTPELDETGTIATFGWIAPLENPGADYILSLTAPTREGRTFVRDWAMAIVPLMG